MSLPANWRKRLIIAAAILSGIEVAIQVALAFELKPAWLPAGSFAALAGLVTVAAFSTRTIVQGDDE